MLEFIVNNWLSVATLVGGATAFIVERNKRNVEVDSVKADVMEKMRTVYLGFVEDSERKLQELQKTISSLRETIVLMEKELEITRGENVRYQEEIEVLTIALRKAEEDRQTIYDRLTLLEKSKNKESHGSNK